MESAFPGSDLPPTSTEYLPESWSAEHGGFTDDELYLEFVDAIGGSTEDISAFRRQFLPIAQEAYSNTTLPFVDVGCGRGEFLELLRSEAIDCIGVDTNAGVVARLAADGFAVRQQDAVGFLRAMEPESLAGLSAFNVIEHVDPDYFIALLRLLATRVARGGAVVLQTSSPENPFESAVFSLDLTHRRLYHPKTVAFHLAQMGFDHVRITYQDPAPVPLRLSGADSSAYRSYAVIGFRMRSVQVNG